MGVNLWGESPLYVNPVNVLITLTKVLAEDKGGTARDRLKEVRGLLLRPVIASIHVKILSTSKTLDMSDLEQVGKPYMLWTDQKSKSGK